MSSPVNYYLGNNELLQMFECRGLKGTPDSWWIDGQYYAKVSYAIFDTTTDTIKRRATQPISNVNAVPDDLWFEDGWWKHSWHTHDKTEGWFGFVYKSREFDKGLVFDYKATLDGKTIGEIYFTNSNKVRFWHSNQQGMWEGYLDNSQPPNGGSNMKQPQIKLVGNKLEVINPIATAVYSWQYSKTPNGYDGWLGFGNTYEIPIDKQYKGYEFWCYQKEGLDKSIDSERIVYGGEIEPPIIIPEPTDNEAIKTELQLKIAHIQGELEEMYGIVDTIK